MRLGAGSNYAYLQHEVKRRMAQLKDSILEANCAVDAEREKNVSLLHMIFPPDVAKRLWLGAAIPFFPLYSSSFSYLKP